MQRSRTNSHAIHKDPPNERGLLRSFYRTIPRGRAGPLFPLEKWCLLFGYLLSGLQTSSYPRFVGIKSLIFRVRLDLFGSRMPVVLAGPHGDAVEAHGTLRAWTKVAGGEGMTSCQVLLSCVTLPPGQFGMSECVSCTSFD